MKTNCFAAQAAAAPARACAVLNRMIEYIG